ncbi:MAG: cyclopropane-fatty-acyl-phospholipid synthase family protein, partial [Parasphingorhabdus sp.]
KQRARQNIQYHYDLGNDFYRLWLDDSMSYSSAIFANDKDSLEQAQRNKIDAIAERLSTKAGDKVLEIGCGWGSLSGSLARDRKLDVTGISLSDEQTAWAREHHPEAQYLIQDYRDVEGQYDAIASVEMVEAVGQQYWPDFLDSIARNLKPGGRAGLQYITIADDFFEQYAASADFIQTYIFPGGMLLSESRFRELAEARGLRWTDQNSFGIDYAETLKLWRDRFDQAVESGALPAGFDERFVRLWRFYLAYCEGGFRAGGIDVAQVTLIKER